MRREAQQMCEEKHPMKGGPIYQPPGTHLLTPGDPKNRKSENSQKSFFSQFRLKLGRFGGFQDDRTAHTVIHANFQPIWSYMASKSQLFDVFRKTDISKYYKWHSKPSILSRVSPGHLHYFSSISHQHIFPKIYFPQKKRCSFSTNFLTNTNLRVKTINFHYVDRFFCLKFFWQNGFFFFEIFHEFSMEAALAADKNQDWTPRPNLPAAWRLPRWG